jgi:Winged helix DNA-binding domain
MADRPADGAVLDRRTLNRTLLARQLLLERVDAEPLDVVEQLVGMQSQEPLDPYVGLWTRLRSFDPEALGRALLERRALRMPLLRSTLHLVTSDDALRVRPLLQEMVERAFASSSFARDLAGLDVAPVLACGTEAVERRPRTLAELREVLAEEWPDRDPNALAYAVRYLVPLVQVTPRGVWGQKQAPTVTTLAAWLGREPQGDSTLDELVLRYLRAFGPASAADIRAWSWLSDVRSIVDGLRPRLHVYRDEGGGTLYDADDGVFADSATPAPVRFLPQYDNVFLSHADRGRIMGAVTWNRSFTHRGSFLADGFLAGAWKLTATGSETSLAVDIRTRLRSTLRRQVREEAEALLAFLAPEARSRRLTLG